MYIIEIVAWSTILTFHAVCSFIAFLTFGHCHLEKCSRRKPISWLARLLSLGKIGMIQISIWNVLKVRVIERFTGEICKNQRPVVQFAVVVCLHIFAV